MVWFSKHDIFGSFFIIAKFPFRAYNAVYTIIYEMMKYDK